MCMHVTLQRGSSYISSHAGMHIVNGMISNLDICSFSFLNDMSHTSRWISNGSIIKATILLQCLGETNYQDIANLNSDVLFSNILGQSISPETLRQRLNQISEQKSFFDILDSSNTTLLKHASFSHVTFNGEEYIPLDIDVTPFINPNVHKEGVECTYKKEDGFAPIMAYLGSYALCFELRPGSQHSENGALEFVSRCFKIIKQLNLDLSKILVRLDSAHDAGDLIKLLDKFGVKYLIKRNLRGESHSDIIVQAKLEASPMVSSNLRDMLYRIASPDTKPTNAPESAAFAIYEIADPIRDDKGYDPYSLIRITDPNNANYGKDGIPYEVSSWWTNLTPYTSANPIISKDREFVSEVIDLYKDHATSEQYHSEIKTDMSMELLPSHYFDTNKAYLGLAVISFNILRLIGDKALKINNFFQHHKQKHIQRIRVCTVIKKLINIPCKIVMHARKIIMQLTKDAPIFDTFSKIFQIWC